MINRLPELVDTHNNLPEETRHEIRAKEAVEDYSVDLYILLHRLRNGKLYTHHYNLL